MNVLVIGAGFASVDELPILPFLPLSLGELNATVKQLGHNVSILDLNVHFFVSKKSEFKKLLI